MTKAVFTFYNGTSLQKYPLSSVEVLQKNANDMIIKGLKHGDDIKEQIRHYTLQLTTMEQAMVRICNGGMMNDKAYERWAQELKKDELSLASIWHLDVAALVKLKAIKDDNNNGFMIMD